MDLTTKRSWILLTLCTKYCLCYQLQLKDIQWKFSLYLLTPGPKSMNVFLTSPPHCWYALLCLVQNTEPHIQVLQVHNMRTRCTSRTNGLVTWRTIAPTVIHETLMSLLFVLSNIWGEYQIFLKETIIKTQQSTSSFYLQNDRWHSVRYTKSSSLGASLTSSTCVCSSSSSSSSSHYQPKSYANHHQQRYLPQMKSTHLEKWDLGNAQKKSLGKTQHSVLNPMFLLEEKVGFDQAHWKKDDWTKVM